MSKKNTLSVKYCKVSRATQKTHSFRGLKQLRSCSPASLSLVPREADLPEAFPRSEPLTTTVARPSLTRHQPAPDAGLTPGPDCAGPIPKVEAAEPAPGTRGCWASRDLDGPLVSEQAPPGSRRKKPALQNGENGLAAFAQSS